MKKDFVEMVEYINSKGVVIKRTLGGKEMPLPMGKTPSYCVIEPIERGMIKRFYSKMEAKEIERNLLELIHKVNNKIQEYN